MHEIKTFLNPLLTHVTGNWENMIICNDQKYVKPKTPCASTLKSLNGRRPTSRQMLDYTPELQSRFVGAIDHSFFSA
jgi:hypothetical protein